MNIHTRVALSSTCLAVLCAMAFVAQWLWSNDRYHQEVTQRLHADLAQYIVDHLSEPLFDDALQVNHKVLKSIAMNTMMINPSVEVYLLDQEGMVLGHALPEKEVEANQIDVRPIIHWLNDSPSGAVLGENPRDPSITGIFSVTPVMDRNEARGYLYVLLGSHQQQTIASALEMSHAFRVGLVGLLVTALLFVALAWLAFHKLTSPLRLLAQNVRNYRLATFDGQERSEVQRGDEVAELEHSIELMQARIQDQFDRLLESDRLRRELVSNVSHDLRTPLTTIQGYLETLLEFDDLCNDKSREYVQIAHRHSEYLGDLVKHLFELSKLDAGQVAPKLERFSITELIHDVCVDYRLIAEQKNIDLQMAVPEESMLVCADIGLMQRVLQNLMDNALSHTPTGGVICLSARAFDDRVELDVADSGAGIPAEDLPYVFERYYQAGGANTRAKGCGLGLSIVKKILELHQANIEVKSVPDEGTHFQFALASA